MIVEMVAAEIGEGHRAEADAIYAALVEPLARCFHGDMIDALGLERAEVAMQRQSVGRRQFARRQPLRCLDADRPDARGLDAAMRPDLANERRRWRILPFVPVTPTIVSGCGANCLRAARA